MVDAGIFHLFFTVDTQYKRKNSRNIRVAKRVRETRSRARVRARL